MERVKITGPLKDGVVENLYAGMAVSLTGRIIAARDAAHQRFCELLSTKQSIPVTLANQIIYYVGPTPAPPGRVIGACGPTTASRMDAYTPQLLECGLKGMIGKGKRSVEVKRTMLKCKAVYFGAVGGAGALLSQYVKKCRVLAYPELGPEAVFELEVVSFPLFVVNDIYGGDFYEEGRHKYANNFQDEA